MCLQRFTRVTRDTPWFRIDGLYLVVDLREVASVILNAISLRSQFTMDLTFVESSILIYNSRVNSNRVDTNLLGSIS